MASSGRRTKTKYITFENSSNMAIESYEPVDIYSADSQGKLLSEKLTWRQWIYQICCCKTQDLCDSPMENPNSSLVGRVGRSYTLTKETAFHNQQLPILTATRVIDDDFTNTNTKLEKTKTSYAENSLDRERSNSAFGERSFVREILSCRDSFIKSLEWCDNSLTRGKRCRLVKHDAWTRSDSQGTLLAMLACPSLQGLVSIIDITGFTGTLIPTVTRTFFGTSAFF